MVTREGTEKGSLPFSRKYLGSKRLLRDRIARWITETAGTPGTFLDGFCGTGAVSFALAGTGRTRVIAVDSLRSNCIILRGCGSARADVKELMDRLNALPPRTGYISESYAGTYFTRENCGRMDAIRQEIEDLRAAGRSGSAEHDVLLGSFLLAADRVANTIGQYDAYLKNIDSRSMVAGRHLVDQRVRTPFMLQPLAPFPGPGGLAVIEGDMLDLAPRLAVDAAYFDPPYNHRQYCDNYHVLENLARWEKPPLAGKTRKFDQAAARSPFSRRRDAAGALRRLVEGTRARHLFLSYSSEGILSREAIRDTLSLRGPVDVTDIPYPVFGNGAGVAARRVVTEHLFHVALAG